MSTPKSDVKKIFEQHNAVNHQGGQPHGDPSKQCQCEDCKAYWAQQ